MVRGDLPPPRLITPRGALRRSLLLPGWGQLATGDRRGVPIGAALLAGLGALVGLGPVYASGTAAPLVGLAGAALLAGWAGTAIHAHRRASRRRAVFGLGGGDHGALDLLVLAPIVVAAATALWIASRAGSSPEGAVADYVLLWRNDAAGVAAGRFVTPPGAMALDVAWDRQRALLHDELLRLAAADPDAGIDASDPTAGVRYELAGDGVVELVVARREPVRELILGILPTTSQRLVPVARLGTIRLALTSLAGPVPGGPEVDAWRIRSVEVLGATFGD